MSEPDPRAYLEYLDKEMTIMGVLSAFIALVAGFAIDRLATADASSALGVLWKNASWWILAGSVAALASALAFYMQRSHLAWLYGQIALCDAGVDSAADSSVTDWLSEADSWATWIRYRWGFGFLFVALIEFFTAVVGQVGLDLAQLSGWVFLPPLIAVSVLTVISVALQKYPFEEEPILEFLPVLRVVLRRPKKPLRVGRRLQK